MKIVGNVWPRAAIPGLHQWTIVQQDHDIFEQPSIAQIERPSAGVKIIVIELENIAVAAACASSLTDPGGIYAVEVEPKITQVVYIMICYPTQKKLGRVLVTTSAQPSFVLCQKLFANTLGVNHSVTQ